LNKYWAWWHIEHCKLLVLINLQRFKGMKATSKEKRFWPKYAGQKKVTVKKMTILAAFMGT